jgi:NAD+ kinase
MKMKTLKNIGIIAFEKKKQIEETLRAIVSDEDFRSNRFFLNRDVFSFKMRGLALLPARAFLKKIDVLVSFGGDGTFISAARMVRGTDIPLIGVNMGSLGFLTDIPASGAALALKRIFSGRYTREKRMMFEVTLKRKGATIARDICLNDAVLKGNRLFNLSVHCGTELVSAYNADGLIVSTPTGSTAYSMASGGPIVYPTLECAIITPICSHSLTQKPIVSSISTPIILRINDKRAQIMLYIDGKDNLILKDGDEICISRSGFVTTLLKPEEITYFSLLRKKLHWGSD